MTGRIRNWRVVYLMRHMALSSAVPDAKARGYFRHEQIVTAKDQRSILNDLLAKGAVPVEVKPIKQPHPLLRGSNRQFRLQFLLAVLYSIEGGVAPGRALEQVIESEKGPIRAQLNVGLNLLRQGRSFLDAFEAMDLYDASTLALIRAGEETGKLAHALRSALEHLERSSNTLKLMAAPAAVIALDLIVAVTTILGTRFGLIPYLRKQGVSGGTPEQVQDFEHALNMATWVNDAMLAVTAVAFIAIFAAVYVYTGRDEQLRNKFDGWMLKLPLMRSLVLHSAISNTTAVMSSLLRGGVHFLPASKIAAKATKLYVVVDYWIHAHRSVGGGSEVRLAVAADPMSNNEKMILLAHKDFKQLADAYGIVAKQRDDQSRAAAKLFGAALFTVGLLYSGLCVLVALFAAWVQNKGALGGLGGGA